MKKLILLGAFLAALMVPPGPAGAQSAQLEREVSYLVSLLTTPYAETGIAYGTTHGNYRVTYRYRYRIDLERLSAASIRIEQTNDVRNARYAGEFGRYTTSGGYAYKISVRGTLADALGRRWPGRYYNPTVDFAGKFQFAKFGRAPCPVSPRESCPSPLPYVMMLNGIPIIHERHHIDEIYEQLRLIESLAAEEGG